MNKDAEYYYGDILIPPEPTDPNDIRGVWRPEKKAVSILRQLGEYYCVYHKDLGESWVPKDQVGVIAACRHRVHEIPSLDPPPVFAPPAARIELTIEEQTRNRIFIPSW